MTKVGRNDPCPCGSGKKYKRCPCGAYEATQFPVSKACAAEQAEIERHHREMYARIDDIEAAQVERDANGTITAVRDERPRRPRGARRRLWVAMALALMGGMPIGPRRSDT